MYVASGPLPYERFVHESRKHVVIWLILEEMLNIKHISGMNMRRKKEPVGIGIDLLYNLNWSNLSWFEFVILTCRKPFFDKNRPDVIPNLKINFSTPFIHLSFILNSGLCQVVLCASMNVDNFINKLQRPSMKLAGLRDSNQSQQTKRNHTVDYLERTEAKASIMGMVVSKLCLTQKRTSRPQIISNKAP